MSLICENCGKEIDGTYGSGRFCSKNCACSFNAKKGVDTAKRKGNLIKAREAMALKRTTVYNNPEICSYCGKECKNHSSLINHERLCKKNPQKSYLRSHGEDWKQKTIEANKKKVIKKESYICKFCGKNWITTKSGFKLHERSCNKNLDKCPVKGHRVSEETKKKISEGQKLAHKEGRNSSWIGRRKRSYAEQSWFNILEKSLGQNSFKNNYAVEGYFLDFAWPEKKIYFEVDGETHYTEEGVKHDQERALKLEKAGWSLVDRCRWSNYQKLSEENKEIYIKNILNKILSMGDSVNG